MKRMKRYLLIIIGTLWAVPLALSGQDYQAEDLQPAPLSEAAWAAAKEGLDYQQPESVEERTKAEQQSQTTRGGGEQDASRRNREPWIDGAWARTIFQLLFWVSLAVGIAFLLRYLLGIKRAPPNPRLAKTGTTAIDLAAIEDNLHQADLEEFLRHAIANGDYTLAVRLYYLTILQALSLRKIIAWKKDKTNRQYLHELNGTSFADGFAAVTQLFERAWYGAKPLDAQAFEEIAPRFQELAQRIQDTKSVAHAD